MLFWTEGLNGYQDNRYYTCLAELYFLDENGKEIPGTKWKVVCADGEEVDREDGKSDNIFDLQSTTYWQIQYTGTWDGFPYQIIIDLGTIKSINGIKFLQRQDQVNGRIKDYNIYISKEIFPDIETLYILIVKK